jgi:ATP-dependent protease ClpP protease subunit
MSDQNPATHSLTPQPVSAAEADLKLRLLQAQVANEEVRLERAKRDDLREKQETELKLRQQQAQTKRAELELANLERESAKANAEQQEARVYTFAEQVSDQSIKQAISEIAKLARRFPGQPLTIRLTSPGGSVYHGFALYDFLRSLSKGGNQIIVEVLGMAASMGGIVLQAGDIRRVGEQAFVLVHEVSSGTEGKVSLQQDRLDQSWRLWDKLAHILSRRAKASFEAKASKRKGAKVKKAMAPLAIKKKAFKFDWWLDAEEAVALGFADEIM